MKGASFRTRFRTGSMLRLVVSIIFRDVIHTEARGTLPVQFSMMDHLDIDIAAKKVNMPSMHSAGRPNQMTQHIEFYAHTESGLGDDAAVKTTKFLVIERH